VSFRNQEFDLKLAQKVSNMMMNIRGLIMDDPEHTIHLRTLEFATRTHTNAGSEAAEIARVCKRVLLGRARGVRRVRCRICIIIIIFNNREKDVREQAQDKSLSNDYRTESDV